MTAMTGWRLVWLGKPLSDAARQEKFRATLAQHAESVLLGRSAILAGWAVGGAGLLMMAVSAYGWMRIYTQPAPQPQFVEIDKSTGIISAPLSLKDAATTFPEAANQFYLKKYILCREEWVPVMDRANDRCVKLMSSPDEQVRYEAWRSGPHGPAAEIGPNGHISIADNWWRFHPEVTVTAPDGVKTLRYEVQFLRTVWHGNVPEKEQRWSAEVDFQWHPLQKMSEQDRNDNLGGFQAISYNANSDALQPRS